MRVSMLMPNAPDMVCGLSDHGRNLGDAMRALGFDIRYLARHTQVNGSGTGAAEHWDGSPNRLVEAARKSDCDILWVQYSGYGFSAKGLPFNLARALRRVRDMACAPMIVVFMHETHPNLDRLGWHGPITQRLQMSVTRRIVSSADVVFASVETNLRRCIDEYGVPREAISLLPVASNIPDVPVSNADRLELRSRLGLAGNARVAAVFGLWSTQRRALALFENDLSIALREGRIDHVIAIGGESDWVAGSSGAFGETMPNGQLTVYGPAPAAKVGHILKCCDIGLVATPPAYLEKSGVAAAFAAADLEIWLKDERSKLLIQRAPSCRPTWQETARMASDRISALMETHGRHRG